MIYQFKIVAANKCPKKDVISALDIYCKSVDNGSMTDTNQIKDYIWNTKNHNEEKRTMFFYLLYGSDSSVEGFSEFAYLPENQALVLDYLCTSQRNHVWFYNFYHMVIEEIEETLKRRGQFIRYIITELSLNQINGKLIDVDSNYFRHLLSNENFRLLKYPYYQPPLLLYEQEQEFNLAIKLLSINNDSLLTLEKEQYLSIVKELYYAHYLEWYSNFLHKEQYETTIKKLCLRIEQEIYQKKESEPISLVQCRLFDEGQCPNFTAENMTLPRIKKKKRKKTVLILIWSILTILTFIFCVSPVFSDASSKICSFFTIIAGIISIISFRKDFFGSK